MSEYIVEMPKEPAKVVRDGWNIRIEWQYKQREEIVRCRDCRYAMAYAKAAYCDYMNHIVGIDGFCAWGERE